MADEKKEAQEAPQPPEPQKAPGSLRAILGRKTGVTQFFTSDGECKAVTVVEAGPCTVLRVKAADGKDGYPAVLLGFGALREKATNKPTAGKFKAWGVEPKAFLKEIRVPSASGFAAGQVVDLAGRFAAGDFVDVQGTSKGKGFAGVMKRHHFRGMPASHGSSDKERSPGSLASRRSLGRVLPGQRMAGRMGGETVTVQKVAVVSVEPENNRLYLNGPVPGPAGSLVVVRETVKLIKKVRPKVAQSKKAGGFAGKVEKTAEKAKK